MESKEDLKKVSVLLSKFIRSVEKGKGRAKHGKISMVCKHTKKHVVTQEEFDLILLEKYKIDMSL